MSTTAAIAAVTITEIVVPMTSARRRRDERERDGSMGDLGECVWRPLTAADLRLRRNISVYLV
jgi:hypothetical protein